MTLAQNYDTPVFEVRNVCSCFHIFCWEDDKYLNYEYQKCIF